MRLVGYSVAASERARALPIDILEPASRCQLGAVSDLQLL